MASHESKNSSSKPLPTQRIIATAFTGAVGIGLLLKGKQRQAGGFLTLSVIGCCIMLISE
jgi:FtsH-binding integral membrane protein